jgi:hypothetical protein
LTGAIKPSKLRKTTRVRRRSQLKALERAGMAPNLAKRQTMLAKTREETIVTRRIARTKKVVSERTRRRDFQRTLRHRQTPSIRNLKATLSKEATLTKVSLNNQVARSFKFKRNLLTYLTSKFFL